MKASTTFQQKLGNVSKLNRPIPSSAVGAGIAGSADFPGW